MSAKQLGRHAGPMVSRAKQLRPPRQTGITWRRPSADLRGRRDDGVEVPGVCGTVVSAAADHAAHGIEEVDWDSDAIAG